jgi:hypothetical protein
MVMQANNTKKAGRMVRSGVLSIGLLSIVATEWLALKKFVPLMVLEIQEHGAGFC